MPANRSKSQPTKSRGRPPAATKNPHTAALTVKLRLEDKQELERRALTARHARNLSARWGVSDYVRELLEEILRAES